MTALPKDADRPPDADIETLTAFCFVLAARVAELECSNAQLRNAVGFDPLPPTISESTPWRSIKQVAHVTGYSETMVRELISQNRVVAQKVGGRWFINTAAPMPRKLESAIARSGRTPLTAVDG
jgi:hypothetical protein